MTDADFSTVAHNQTPRRLFEASWSKGAPRPIEEFLFPESDPRYLATLADLVSAELLMSWKTWADSNSTAAASGASSTAELPRVESYLARFPRLDSNPEKLRLIRDEWQVRRAHGDSPQLAEYLDRFPDAAEDALRDVLAERESQDAPGESDTDDAYRTMHSVPSRPAVSGVVLPRTFGNYELLAEIGRGGMGIVYRARQISADREVALKVVRRDLINTLDLDTQATATERFWHEVQAAARLNHENIIALYEVGEVDGEPFFSMRYVEGSSLGDIVRAGPLASRRAAEFMEPVSRAVEHAHGEGILHRDLKPQNILVAAANDQPFVADFGLAKLQETGQELTRSGEVMGSPPYMSPEQAIDSSNVTEHSDVYALGATFYHLLTGRPPFQGATPVETIRQIIDQDPVPPRRLSPSIDLDAETICLKCLEKETTRRYNSAADLADDLARYLRHEPIQARPISGIGRLARWCRRKPVLASLIASTVAALAFGLIAIVVGYVRTKAALAEAEAGYQHARQTVNRFFTRFSEESLLNQHGMQPLREEMLSEAKAFYEQFLRERGSDPQLQDELALTYFRIGRINEQIGKPDDALEAYRRALEMQEDQFARQATDEITHALGNTWNGIGGVLYRQGDWDEAARAHEKAQALRAELVRRESKQDGPLRELANSWMNLGLVEQKQGQREQARENFETAQRLRIQALQLAPSSLEILRDLGMGHYNLAVLLAGDKGADLTIARDEFRQAISRFEQVLGLNPHDLENRNRLIVSSRLLADLEAHSGAHASAARLYQQALEQATTLSQRNPDVPDYPAALAQCYMNLGRFQVNQGALEDARRSFAEALAILDELVQQHTEDAAYLRDLAVSCRALAAIEVAENQFEQAIEHLKTAEIHFATLVQRDPDNPRYAALLEETRRLIASLAEPSAATSESPGDAES